MTVKGKTRHPNARGFDLSRRCIREGVNMPRRGARGHGRGFTEHTMTQKAGGKSSRRMNHPHSPHESPPRASNQKCSLHCKTEKSVERHLNEEKHFDFTGAKDLFYNDAGCDGNLSLSPKKVSDEEVTGGIDSVVGLRVVDNRRSDFPSVKERYEDAGKEDQRSVGWSVLSKAKDHEEISKSDEEEMLRLSQSSVSEELALEGTRSEVDAAPPKRKKEQISRESKIPRMFNAERLSRHIHELMQHNSGSPLQNTQHQPNDLNEMRTNAGSQILRNLYDKEAPSPDLSKAAGRIQKCEPSLMMRDYVKDHDRLCRDSPKRTPSSELLTNVVITVHCVGVPDLKGSKNEEEQYERNELDARAAGDPPCVSRPFSTRDAIPTEEQTLKSSAHHLGESALREEGLHNIDKQQHANAHKRDEVQRDVGSDNIAKSKDDAFVSESRRTTDVVMDIEESPRRRGKKSKSRRNRESVSNESSVQKLNALPGEDGYCVSQGALLVGEVLREQLLRFRVGISGDLETSKDPARTVDSSSSNDRTSNENNPHVCMDVGHQRTDGKSRRRQKRVKSLAHESVTEGIDVSEGSPRKEASNEDRERNSDDVMDRFRPLEKSRGSENEPINSVKEEVNDSGSPSQGKPKKLVARRKTAMVRREQEKLCLHEQRNAKCEKNQVMHQDLDKRGAPMSESSGALLPLLVERRQKREGNKLLPTGKQLSDSNGNECVEVDDNERHNSTPRLVSKRPRVTSAAETQRAKHREHIQRLSGPRQSSLMAATSILICPNRPSNDLEKVVKESSSKCHFLHPEVTILEDAESTQLSDAERPRRESGAETKQSEDTSIRDKELDVPGSMPGDMSRRNRMRTQKRKQRDIQKTSSIPPLVPRRPLQERKKISFPKHSARSRVTPGLVLTVNHECQSAIRAATEPLRLELSNSSSGQPVFAQGSEEEEIAICDSEQVIKTERLLKVWSGSTTAEELHKNDRISDGVGERMENTASKEIGNMGDEVPHSHTRKGFESGPALGENVPGAGSSHRLAEEKLMSHSDKNYSRHVPIAKTLPELNLDDLVDPKELNKQSERLATNSTRSRNSRTSGSNNSLGDLLDNDCSKNKASVPVDSSFAQSRSRSKRNPMFQPQQPQRSHPMRTRRSTRMSVRIPLGPSSIVDLTDIADDDNTAADTRVTEDDDDVAESLKELQKLSLEDKAKGINERPRCKYLAPLNEDEVKLAKDLTTRAKADTKIVAINEAGITLRGESFKRLLGTRWLDDEILNAYVSLINSRNDAVFDQMDEDQRAGIPRTYVFNTYFFTRLCSGSSRFDYPGVKGWTKRAKVDILKRDMILFPINLGNYHWVLLGVDMEHKEVIYLDSMHGPDAEGVTSKLKRWVSEELRHKHGEDVALRLAPDSWKEVKHTYRVRRVGVLPKKLEPRDATAGRMSKVPRQTDGGSCGVFTAKMADCLSLGVKVYFKQKDIQLIRRRMALDLFNGYVPL